MRVLRRVTASGMALCAAAVAFTACSSDSSGSGGKPSDSVALTVIAPTNSKPPNFPELIASAKAAATAVNAKGGIKGKQIEIKTCNESNNPNDATKCARQAVANHSVAVVGSFSTYGQQVTQILAGAGIPYIGFNGATPAEYACSTCYEFDAGSTLVFAGLPGALRASGAKTVQPIALDLAASAANVAGVEQAAKAAGLRTLPAVKVGVTSTDLAPAVQAVIQSKADAAVSILPTELTLAFIKAADQAKASFTFGVVDGQIQSGVSQIHGTQDDHLLVVGAYPPVDADDKYPGIAQYNRELDAAVKAGDKDASIRNSSGLRAWLTVHVVAEVGAGITGDVSASSLNTAFKSAKDVDLLGILPKWTPSAKGTIHGFDRVSSARVFFLRLGDGKFTAAKPVAGVDLTSGKPFTD
ncbi:putative Branched-chain amino acid ABC transporter substrate-binding protein [Frankia canadensis]|uniref:Putative Branched-chain amino acid ABC transporter substrate-binding protein n=1 Tax=Frankia canadensis TaxID=1836972 RepID=A0A2I2KMD8_9ACTN|nr:ABC transporter substrate-binding protein [Frankia canadensis]SNQ46831.1 putative Branched-chain amino acid ABC transporter substrate-binding protein [Frankia canadensis]SOU54121.1 putative Branched-chain amino acid ABC transporter substrate-binding protein [Frankia canadensis]